MRFHYTPQTEPEELWQFTATEGGYIMTNLYSGNKLTMGNYNTAITVAEGEGTAVRIDKATIATQDFKYIPGVLYSRNSLPRCLPCGCSACQGSIVFHSLFP